MSFLESSQNIVLMKLSKVANNVSEEVYTLFSKIGLQTVEMLMIKDGKTCSANLPMF